MDTASAPGSPQISVVELAAKLEEIAGRKEDAELAGDSGHDVSALNSEEDTASISNGLQS